MNQTYNKKNHFKCFNQMSDKSKNLRKQILNEKCMRCENDPKTAFIYHIGNIFGSVRFIPFNSGPSIRTLENDKRGIFAINSSNLQSSSSSERTTFVGNCLPNISIWLHIRMWRIDVCFSSFFFNFLWRVHQFYFCWEAKTKLKYMDT